MTLDPSSTPTTSLLISGRLARWLKFISVAMITFAAFEAVAVTTAMPYVVDSLGGEQFYALASGIAMVTQLISTALAGPWCDAKDPKQPLYVGISIFVLGLVICTFTPNVWWLIIGRAVQGLGGGLLIVPLYVMVGAYVKHEKRPAFFAAFALAWVLPSLAGPVVAGAFVEYLHWRLVFAICPLMIIVAAPFIVVKFRQFPPIHEPRPLSISRQLVAAAVLSGIFIAVLQSISGIDPDKLSAPFIIASVISSVLLFVVARPMFPHGTFLARRGVPSIVILRAILNGTLVAIELYLVLLLKVVHHWGPTQAGFVVTASSITWAVGSWIQGKLTDEKDRAKLPVIGPILTLLGVLCTLASLLPGMSGWFVLIGWLIAGLGTGMLYPATTVYALAQTPHHQHGEVSSALTVADTLGSALLIAYTGILYALFIDLGSGAFGIAIGWQCILIIASLWLGQRIQPREAVSSASQN